MVRLEGLELGRGIREPEPWDRPERVLLDPPAAVVALDRQFERPGGDGAFGQREGVERALAESGLGDEAPAVGRVNDQRHVIGQLTIAVRITVADDPLATLHRKPQRLEDDLKDGVGLEAVATATAVEHPLDKVVGIERHGLSQLHREVLIGNRGNERPVDEV